MTADERAGHAGALMFAVLDDVCADREESAAVAIGVAAAAAVVAGHSEAQAMDALRDVYAFTSWSLPSRAPTFPWLELLRPAHRAIPQCYEVRGE